MAGNATLSSELAKLRQRDNERTREYEREIHQKETSIAGLERAVEELTSDLNAAQHQVRILKFPLIIK